jgi:glycolate oxidase FAD binding subunit
MTLATSSAASRLSEVAGAANVIADPAQLAGYELDGKIPSAAVKPASREQTAEIVKFCAAERLAIVPCGARSKLAMGGTPGIYDIALDLTRLDGIVAYDPGDLTLSVEAGIPLQRLAGVLAGHRQFLPLAVPFQSQATAGGTVASGVHSPLRQAYGTVRDFLIGLEFVTGEGAHAKSGGLVVKNVAGYDLHKLMIGALGTLGIITKLNFRTFPAPAPLRVFIGSFASAEGAFDIRQRVTQSHLRPLTMDILSPGAVEILSSTVAARFEAGSSPVDRVAKDKWAFFVTFSGSGAVLERYKRELEQMATETNCEACEISGDERNSASFGRLREFIPIALQSSPATVILKLSVLPVKLKEMFDAVRDASQASGLRWAAMAGGLGVTYAALVPSASNDEARAQMQKATNHIFDACVRLGGNASIPFCPAEWKQTLGIWGPQRADFEPIRKLKKVFDPVGILAPGRFVGGI